MFPCYYTVPELMGLCTRKNNNIREKNEVRDDDWWWWCCANPSNARSKIKIFSFLQKGGVSKFSILIPKLGQIAIYTMKVRVLEGYPLQTNQPTYIESSTWHQLFNISCSHMSQSQLRQWYDYYYISGHCVCIWGIILCQLKSKCT